MDKDKFIQIYKNIMSNKSSLNDIKFLFSEYCKEKGVKDDDKLDIFIQFLHSSGQLQERMKYPINYYKIKFNICIITNIKGTVLSIF